MDSNDWYKSNTFDYRQFNINELIEEKHRKNLSISLCFPTMNEAGTIGSILDVVKNEVYLPGLVDEVIVIDSGSTDKTADIVKGSGFPLYRHNDILKRVGSHKGKGEALWKSLHVLNGDIIAWCDSDIKNFSARFIYGVIGPLILKEDLVYVKAFYSRPLKLKGSFKRNGGGRVTEILVRPALNLFYPDLSRLIQPLSGEYAGRREVLEQIPFCTGYGVEICMLIEIYKRFGLSSIAQVNLETRVHRNRPLSALSRMSFGIMQALYRKLEYYGKIYMTAELNKVYNQINKNDGRYSVSPVRLEEKERPPMCKVKEYLSAHKYIKK